MLLSAKMLNNVSSVNSYEVATQTAFTEGDLPVIYFKLIDSQSKVERYVPATGATLSITLKNVDTLKTVTKVATNPFVGDTSIWAVQFGSTDHVKGTINLQITLTEGSVVTRGLVSAAILVQPFNSAYV